MGKGDPDIPLNPDPGRDCKQLWFETMLNTVNEAILGELREKIVLQIRRQIEQGRPVAFCYLGEQQVGTISDPNVGELLECLKSAHRYEATISSIDDGLVRVTVRHA